MKHNINIFCNNEKVGIIEIDLNSNNVELIYDENWKNIGFELSPHLKFDKSIDSNSIKKFVNNLLPEGNGLDAISIILQISKANKFGLLEAIGNETAGALTFSPDNIIVTNFREISNEELTERIINKENINITLWDGKVRLSLSGVQDKLPLVVLKDNKYGIGEGKIASTHILKFEKKDDIHLVLNEYFCMKLAKLCGLNVAEVEIRKFGTQNVLFVKRFDREFFEIDDNSFEISKRHIIDGCQLLNLDVNMKYEKVYTDYRGDANFKNLFESSKLKTNKILTKLNLLKWTLFNLCINNFDAHAKNISFFVNKNGLELTPLYDLVNIDMYPQFHNNFAMAFGDEFDSKKIGIYDIVGFCVHIDIQPRLIKNEFKLIVNNIRKNIGIIKNDMLGLYSDNEIKFLEKLESNILDTCKKYEDIFKTLDSAYKSYKDDWL
ncbi:HipA domain-containing protein [Aliarcobacter cryaerophilus]|uniref:HipA domain-containing protein n=1 Tax=Aliarcobacter cryaerophilus TaxID=28198 RepID=UPI0008270DAA|nr:HipA domain-containing protein [Aliarcobacter cryaerophilus]